MPAFNPEISSVVAPLLQIKLYGAVPPITFKLIAPLFIVGAFALVTVKFALNALHKSTI